MTIATVDARAQIHRLVEAFAEAVRRKDVDAVLSLYAPDIVSFDLVPPMQYVGVAEYRRPWEETFAVFDGEIEYEIRDLAIRADERVAFGHSLNRMAGRTVDGDRTDLWVRWTVCLERLDERWRITHEQVSVPVDLASGRAELGLRPDAGASSAAA